MIRAFRKHYRRITAFILTLVLTCMNIGTNLHVAFAVGEEEEALFLVDGAELKEAIREACDSGEVFDFADLNLKAKTKTLKNAYEKLLGKKEGAVYELDVPVNDDYAPDGTSVKVFYNAATEDVAFLFINESDMVVTFRANVDGYETNRVTVNPNPANVEDGETAVYVEDYSNTIMIDDMPHTLGAELIGTEGNAETGEGEPEQETETKAPGGSESLEASTAAEETVEMTQEAEMEDTAAETLPEEAETKETEAVVEEQPEEETEAVVIEIESAEETEEEAATESEVVIEPEIESGELVGMSHHLVDRVGTPEENQEETAVVILDESEETTEAPEEETEQETEEEAMEESEETAAESIEETEEKELEENESSVEETTATAAADTEDEESEEVAMEESSSAAVSEETEEQESSTEEITEAAVEETTEGSVTEGTEAPEDGQMLIDDVNADGENAIVVLGDLEGKPYNTVTIWDSANARAFKVSVEDLEGIEAFGSYAVDYSVDPLGTAEVEGPSYIAEGEDLYFSVTPQVGYVIEQVLANGEEVELADEADLASLSDATKSNADLEDAEEGTAFYVIPDVQEDQEIEVILAEEVLGSHPEFHEEKTVNGVTITVSAEEGILPAGTTLSVEEVTEQVADAVKENVEAEGETNVTDVLAYDINLMLDGKKLSNSYWEGNYVNVKFSGSKIEEISKNSSQIEIAPLETPTVTVEAALGDTEEIAAVDAVTAQDIRVMSEESTAIDVSKDELKNVEFQAKHFTIIVVVGNTTNPNPYVMKVGETIQLRSDASNNGSWSTQSNAISLSEASTRNIINVTANSVTDGYVVVIYTYRSGYRDKTESFKIKVDGPNSTATSYFYIQRPNNDPKDLEDSAWLYVGQGTINTYGLTNQDGTTLQPARGQYSLNIENNVMTYPNDNNIKSAIASLYGIDLADNSVVISWTPYKISYPNGWVDANGQSKDATTPCYHVDMVPNITTKEMATVNYFLWDAGTTGFEPKEIYTVEINSTTQPGGSYPETKVVDGVTYKFMGWYEVSSLIGNKVTFPYEVTESKNFYAKYSPVDELNYSPNFETTATMTSTEGVLGENVSVKENEFTRPGYRFTGWNTQTDGNGTDYIAGSDYILTESDDVLYAQWEAIKANLVLKKVLKDAAGNDASGDITAVTFSLYKANSTGAFSGESSLLVKSGIHPILDGVVTIPDISYYGDANVYYLKETAAAPGYHLLGDAIKITISFDADSNLQYKIGEDSKLYNSIEMYEIVNTTGLEFPITGGPGLGFIKEFGWMLLLFAAAMTGIEVGFYGRRRKKA